MFSLYLHIGTYIECRVLLASAVHILILEQYAESAEYKVINLFYVILTKCLKCDQLSKGSVLL